MQLDNMHEARTMLNALAFPDWLINPQYVTLATWGLVGATFLLTIASLLQYFYSRSQSKEQRERWILEDQARSNEQRDRWAREDQLRKEDAKPKIAVEIAQRENEPEMVFRLFNLGNTIFFVDKMIVNATSPRTSRRTSDLVGPPVLLPGHYISTPYDCDGLITDPFQEANVVFVVRGQHGLEQTDPVWFYVSSDTTNGYVWTIGRLEDRLPGAMVPQPRLIPKEG